MDFRLTNNHIILTVDTSVGPRDCIFDTGGGFTFFFDGDVSSFNIDGLTIAVSPNPMAFMIASQRPAIERLTGCKIDGFITPTSLAEHSILIDFENMQMLLDPEAVDVADAIRMDSKFGLPIFDIEVNGVALHAAYDSGAMYSFVRSDLVGTLGLVPQNKTYEDFNPMFGDFTCTLYTGDISMGQTKLQTQHIATGSAYDQSLQMLGLDGFMGTASMLGHRLYLCYPDRLIMLK